MCVCVCVCVCVFGSVPGAQAAGVFLFTGKSLLREEAVAGGAPRAHQAEGPDGVECQGFGAERIGRSEHKGSLPTTNTHTHTTVSTCNLTQRHFCAGGICVKISLYKALIVTVCLYFGPKFSTTCQ